MSGRWPHRVLHRLCSRSREERQSGSECLAPSASHGAVGATHCLGRRKAPGKSAGIPEAGTISSATRNGLHFAALFGANAMARPDVIRGLQRGLQVMQVLQAVSIASLAEIHRATGISKPSLLRILSTLEE